MYFLSLPLVDSNSANAFFYNSLLHFSIEFKNIILGFAFSLFYDTHDLRIDFDFFYPKWMRENVFLRLGIDFFNLRLAFFSLDFFYVDLWLVFFMYFESHLEFFFAMK